MKKIFLFFFSFLMLISFTSALTHITNCTELQNMQDNLAEDYVLDNNINCSGINFIPVGNKTNTFTGSLDGQNYTISNLFINTNSSYTGLFGYMLGNTYPPIKGIKSLGIINATITSNSFITGGMVGGGSLFLIENSYFFGNISGKAIIGGLVGGGLGSSFDVINSYSIGNLNSTSGCCVGGLIGHHYYGIINNSYSLMNVTGNGDRVGGFVGTSKGTIFFNSYSAGNVTNGLGFLGLQDETSIISSYWDINTSGQVTSDGGEGKTTLEMQNPQTFSSWDLGNNWGIHEGVTYPMLSYEDDYEYVIFYPQFSNFTDNSGTLKGLGIANFSVNLTNTNGTTYLNFNGVDYPATNVSSTYSTSISLDYFNGKSYDYYWYSYGNGSANLYNSSTLWSYILLPKFGTSQSLYFTFVGSGSGLGRFMQVIAVPLFIFIVLLVFVGIFTWIGYAIVNAVKGIGKKR